MKSHEINRIPERELVDIFMDNASARLKLWEIFNEKVNGTRTMLKIKLLSKHMTYLEQGRVTKIQTHKKKKPKKGTEAVHAIQYDATQQPYGQYRGRGRRSRGGRKHTTRWRRDRFNKRRQPHQGGVNCHQYGHTPETCWQLHPHLKPKTGAKRKQVFALQRAANKAEEEANKARADLEKAIQKYESSTESDHNPESEASTDGPQEEDHKENETSRESTDNNDSESSSPIKFQYRPRQ